MSSQQLHTQNYVLALLEKNHHQNTISLFDEFMARIDAVLAWDMDAVDATVKIKKELSDKGTPIGNNDAMIAGHAVSGNCVLVTHNRKEFERVLDLEIEDWTVF